MPAAAATVTVTDNASDTANVDVSCTHTRRRYSSASDSSDSYTLATDDEELESLAGASDVSSDGFEWVEPLTPSSPAISHLPLDLDITDFDLDITLDDAAYLYTLATYPPSPFDIDLRDLGLDVDLDLALIPSLLPLPAEYIPTLLPLPMQMAMHMHMDMFPLPGGNVHPIHTHTQSYIQTHTHTHTNSHPPPPYSHADANIGSSSGGGGSSGNNMESNTMTPNNPTDHRIAALQQAIRDGTVTANQTRNVQRVIADLRDGVEWSLYQDGVRVTHETRNFSRLLWKEAVTGAAVAAA